MTRKGTTCVHCGKAFHACPSCGLVGAEWDYCSRACYEAAGIPTHDAAGDEYEGGAFLGSLISGRLLKARPLRRKGEP